MSIELRKILFRWGQVKERPKVMSPLMFPTREGDANQESPPIDERGAVVLGKRPDIPGILARHLIHVRRIRFRSGRA